MPSSPSLLPSLPLPTLSLPPSPLLHTLSPSLPPPLPLSQPIFGSLHPEYIGYLYLVAPISLVLLNPLAFLLMEYDTEEEAPACGEGQPSAGTGASVSAGAPASPLLPASARQPGMQPHSGEQGSLREPLLAAGRHALDSSAGFTDDQQLFPGDGADAGDLLACCDDVPEGDEEGGEQQGAGGGRRRSMQGERGDDTTASSSATASAGQKSQSGGESTTAVSESTSLLPPSASASAPASMAGSQLPAGWSVRRYTGLLRDKSGGNSSGGGISASQSGRDGGRAVSSGTAEVGGGGGAAGMVAEMAAGKAAGKAGGAPVRFRWDRLGRVLYGVVASPVVFMVGATTGCRGAHDGWTTASRLAGWLTHMGDSLLPSCTVAL